MGLSTHQKYPKLSPSTPSKLLQGGHWRRVHWLTRYKDIKKNRFFSPMKSRILQNPKFMFDVSWVEFLSHRLLQRNGKSWRQRSGAQSGGTVGEWVPNLECVDRCDCEPFPNVCFDSCCVIFVLAKKKVVRVTKQFWSFILRKIYYQRVFLVANWESPITNEFPTHLATSTTSRLSQASMGLRYTNQSMLIRVNSKKTRQVAMSIGMPGAIEGEAIWGCNLSISREVIWNSPTMR